MCLQDIRNGLALKKNNISSNVFPQSTQHVLSSVHLKSIGDGHVISSASDVLQCSPVLQIWGRQAFFILGPWNTHHTHTSKRGAPLKGPCSPPTLSLLCFPATTEGCCVCISLSLFYHTLSLSVSPVKWLHSPCIYNSIFSSLSLHTSCSMYISLDVSLSRFITLSFHLPICFFISVVVIAVTVCSESYAWHCGAELPRVTETRCR